MLTRRFALLSLLLLCALPVAAHQGAHPTGLDPCDDAIKGLVAFHLYGEGVVGSRDQPILEPQSYRLVNVADFGEIPHSLAKISFTIGDGHNTGYGDYTVRVVLPRGTYEFNAANFQGNWVIHPLVDGWSGTMEVTIQSETCDVAMQATASWNLPRSSWIRNPCEPCRNLTCHATTLIGSVDLSIPIGVVQYGLEPVALRYESEQLPNGGAAALKVEGPDTAGPVIHSDGNGVVTAVECGDHLTRITTEASPGDPNRCVIRVSSDKTDPDDTIYREAILESVTLPGGVAALRFTETVSGQTSTRTYTQPAANLWVLDEDDLRRTTKTSVSETATTRVTNWQIEERDAAGAWVLVEERDEHETNYDWSWTLTTLINDPNGAALTTTWDYYENHEFTGPNADTSGRGRLERETLPNGLVREYEYLDTDPFNSGYTQVEIVREAFAGNSLAQERRRHVAFNGSDLSELHETWVAGTLIERTEISAHSSGGSNWRNELRYPAAGGPPLLTRIELDQWATNPLLSKTTFPDGTIEEIYASEAGGLKTVTIYRGVDNPGPGFPIITGQEVRTVINGIGQTVHSETCEIRNGAVFPVEMRLATQFDALARPTSTEVYHSSAATPTFTDAQLFGCCGVSTEEGQDGLPVTYYYDDLARLRKVHRNGLSTETIYDGLTVRTHLYPEAAATSFSLATAQNELSNATRNLAGDLVAESSRAPHDGSLVTTTYAATYNAGGGVGHRIVQTLPLTPSDQGVAPTVTEEFYLDGRLKRRTGSPVADRLVTYGFTPAGRTTTMALLDHTATARQAVTTQLDWIGRALKTTYSGDADSDGNPDSELYEYDAAGRLAKQTDADGVTQLYEYEPSNELIRVALDLNGNGLVDLDSDEVRITRNGMAAGPGGETLSWSERVVREFDGMGAGIDHVLSRRESNVNLLESRTHLYTGGAAATSHLTTSYLPGQPGAWNQSISNPDGTALTQQYRGGLLTQESLQAADATTLLTRTFAYDSRQRLSLVTDTSAPSLQHTYVAPLVDQLATFTIGTRTTTFSYDARGRRTFTDEPDSVDSTGAPVDNRQEVSYWPHDRVREVTGTPGYRRSFTYDFAQRLETLTTFGTHQTTTRWEYDSNRGWLNGKRYSSPAPGAGTGESYFYTPGGRLRQRLTARGITTDFAHGPDGRLNSMIYDDGTPSVVIDGRDRRGRIAQLTDGAGTRVLTYTDQDSLATTSHQAGSLLAGWSVSQHRDGLERLTALKLQHGATTPHRLDYAYDSAGRLASVEGNALKAHYQYDPARQLVSQLAIVDDQRPLHFATRQHDALHRLERITYHNGNLQGAFAVHSDYHYTRDSFGRVTHATLRDGSQWRYTYHGSGELASARRHLTADSQDLLEGHSFAWSYDGIGNRIGASRGGDRNGTGLRNTAYTPNSLNQYSAIQTPGFAEVTGAAPLSPDVHVNGAAAGRQGSFFRLELASDNSTGPVWQPVSVTQGASSRSGSLLVPPANTTPQYDADGNLTSDGVHEYSWDAENRLTKVETLPSAVTAGLPYQRVEFTYDSDSRRVQRLLYDQPSPAPPLHTTRYLFASWRRLGELDHTDTLQRSYAWGLDNDDRLHLGDSNAALLWLHDHSTNETHLTSYDGNGNITGLLSAQTDLPTATYTYSPFGQLLTSTGPYAEKNPYRFSTKPFEPVGQLYNYGFRHYHPRNGRWLSRDPIAEDGGLNVYGFLGNEPNGATDLLGLFLKTTDDPRHAGMMAQFYGHTKKAAALAGIGVAFVAGQDLIENIAAKYGARECDDRDLIGVRISPAEQYAREAALSVALGNLIRPLGWVFQRGKGLIAGKSGSRLATGTSGRTTSSAARQAARDSGVIQNFDEFARNYQLSGPEARKAWELYQRAANSRGILIGSTDDVARFAGNPNLDKLLFNSPGTARATNGVLRDGYSLPINRAWIDGAKAAGVPIHLATPVKNLGQLRQLHPTYFQELQWILGGYRPIFRGGHVVLVPL